jgi:hypothetical protein
MKITLDGQEVEMDAPQIIAEAERRDVTVHSLTCQHPRTCVICSPQFCLRDIIDEVNTPPA